MKHYLTAEWGRAVARPYFRAFLLVLLALAAGLPLLWRFGLGDMFQGSFGDSLSLLTPFFPRWASIWRWSWRTRSFPINIRMIP